MFKALFRLAGLLVLALALISAVLDIARSIADSALVITPLGKDWLGLSESSLGQVEVFVSQPSRLMVSKFAIEYTEFICGKSSSCRVSESILTSNG